MTPAPAIQLTYRLDVRTDRAAVRGVVVTFSLENRSATDLWVLKWYTPLEGIKGKIFTVQCDGVTLPYEGRMVKRAAPGADDYLLIRSGDTASAGHDLSTVFRFPASGLCVVRFSGRLHDVAPSQEPIPRAPERHQAITIPGNSLTFELPPETPA